MLACALFFRLSSGGLFLVAENAGQLVQFRPQARNEDYSVYRRFIPQFTKTYLYHDAPTSCSDSLSPHLSVAL